MYNAYGMEEPSDFITDAYQNSPETMFASGSTNLHMDMSDAINIMMFSSSPDRSTGDSRQGAIWDIYPMEAIPHLRSQLWKEAARREWHITEPIHDQCFYVHRDIRQRLRAHRLERKVYEDFDVASAEFASSPDLYTVETQPVLSWRIHQQPGDAGMPSILLFDSFTP